MSNSFHKLWVQKNLNEVAINRAKAAIDSIGMALPCHVVAVAGSIVTVAFDVSDLTLPEITIPKAESAWMRSPTQIGDMGITMAADVYLGGVSGLGGGMASYLPTASLESLIFVPVSNKNSPPIDQNAAQVQGPNGAIIRTTAGTVSQIVTDTSGTTIDYAGNTVNVSASGVIITVGSSVLQVTASSITLTAGGQTFTLASPGTTSSANLTAPDVIVSGKSVNNHYHSDPQGGNVGPMTG